MKLKIKLISDEQLTWVVNDILLVGTTGLAANLLQWALLFLALNPKVCEKLNKEIEAVVGFRNNKIPSLDDRAKYIITTGCPT